MDLSQYKSSELNLSMNQMLVPINIIPPNEIGMEECNILLEWLYSNYRDDLLRTPSGGIALNREAWDRFPCFDVRARNGGLEITAVLEEGIYRFQFRNFGDDKADISGHKAFLEFKSICEKYNINIDDFRISYQEGLEEKKLIESPIIDSDCRLWSEIDDYGYEGVHHLDIHSAHMAGVAKSYSKLYEPINYIYTNRKPKDESEEEQLRSRKFKAILTHSWGYFQSIYSPIYYGFAHLSRAGIAYTNSVIKDLSQRLEESGRAIIAHNTDGIWYVGDVYHGEGEGKSLGEWSNDYTDCRFRMRSTGAYEFICDGEYHAVVRGRTSLDAVKPRELWEWGDIYRCGDTKQEFGYDKLNHRIYKREVEI